MVSSCWCLFENDHKYAHMKFKKKWSNCSPQKLQNKISFVHFLWLKIANYFSPSAIKLCCKFDLDWVKSNFTQ